MAGASRHISWWLQLGHANSWADPMRTIAADIGM
jgi:hypothetical protein